MHVYFSLKNFDPRDLDSEDSQETFCRFLIEKQAQLDKTGFKYCGYISQIYLDQDTKKEFCKIICKYQFDSDHGDFSQIKNNFEKYSISQRFIILICTE